MKSERDQLIKKAEWEISVFERPSLATSREMLALLKLDASIPVNCKAEENKALIEENTMLKNQLLALKGSG